MVQKHKYAGQKNISSVDSAKLRSALHKAIRQVCSQIWKVETNVTMGDRSRSVIVYTITFPYSLCI